LCPQSVVTSVFLAVQIAPRGADIDATRTHNTASPVDVLIVDKHNAAFIYFEAFDLTFVRGGGLEYVQAGGAGEYSAVRTTCRVFHCLESTSVSKDGGE